MKLTRNQRYQRASHYKSMRTEHKVKPLGRMVSFVGGTTTHTHRTQTLLELVGYVDKVTVGREYKVTWYTLDGEYISIMIECDELSFVLYCKDVLNVLENFLHVECVIEERYISPSKGYTEKTIKCNRG